MVNVKIEDHIPETKAKINDALMLALEEIGVLVEGYAKEELSKTKEHKTKPSPRPNVDTGRLRNSIVYEVDGAEQSVKVGSNVEYAPYLEFGTSRMPQGYPYLKPAVEHNMDKYTKVIAQELGKIR